MFPSSVTLPSKGTCHLLLHISECHHSLRTFWAQSINFLEEWIKFSVTSCHLHISMLGWFVSPICSSKPSALVHHVGEKYLSCSQWRCVHHFADSFLLCFCLGILDGCANRGMHCWRLMQWKRRASVPEWCFHYSSSSLLFLTISPLCLSHLSLELKFFMWEAVSFRVNRKWLCKFEESSLVSKFYFISHNQSWICGSHESKRRMLDSRVQMVPLIVVVSLYEFWGRFS